MEEGEEKAKQRLENGAERKGNVLLRSATTFTPTCLSLLLLLRLRFLPSRSRLLIFAHKLVPQLGCYTLVGILSYVEHLTNVQCVKSQYIRMLYTVLATGLCVDSNSCRFYNDCFSYRMLMHTGIPIESFNIKYH